MTIPKYEPDSDKWEPWESGATETKTVQASPEDIVHGDGESTLIMAIRMGMKKEDRNSDDSNFFMLQAIPEKFLQFLRDKDTDGIMRRHIANYLREVADSWESGEVLTK